MLAVSQGRKPGGTCCELEIGPTLSTRPSLLAEAEEADEVCRDKLEVEACQASKSDPSLSPRPFLYNLVELLYRGLGSSAWGFGLKGTRRHSLGTGAVAGAAEIRFPQPGGKR